MGTRLRDVAHQVQTSGRLNRGEIAAQAQAGELVRIGRRVWMSVRYLAGFDKPWEAAGAVALARVLVVMANARGPAPVLTGRIGALVHGIDVWPMPVDVDVVVPAARTRRVTELPEVVVETPSGDGEETAKRRTHAAARVVRHHSPWLEAEAQAGKWATVGSARAIAAWCALHEEAESAFVTICGVLSLLAGFDRDDPDGSLVRAAACKEEILRLIGNRPGAARARMLVDAASAGCESVLERRVLYHLWRMGFGGIVVQYKVIVPGRTRFVDAALPECSVAVESEGRAKRGAEGTGAYERSLSDREERVADLHAVKWVVVHVYWRDLDDPRRLIDRIVRAAGAGIPLNPVELPPGCPCCRRDSSR